MHFTAGRVPIPDYEEWAGQVDLTPQHFYDDGEEWRADYEPGTTIRWLVWYSSETIPTTGEDRDLSLAKLAQYAGAQFVVSARTDEKARNFGPSIGSVAVEVEADSEQGASDAAREAIARAVSHVARSQGRTGSLGWTMGVSARPLDMGT